MWTAVKMIKSMEKRNTNANNLFLTVIYMERYLGAKEKKEEKKRGLSSLKFLKLDFIA